MMVSKVKWKWAFGDGGFGLFCCVILFWLQLVGMVCFLYGFFPIKHPVGGYASPEEDYPSYEHAGRTGSNLGTGTEDANNR